jgi:hypothetical protein
MIRIEITADAYATLVSDVPPERRLEALRSPSGGFYLLLDRVTLDRLTDARGAGESYSDVILRMVKESARCERGANPLP